MMARSIMACPEAVCMYVRIAVMDEIGREMASAQPLDTEGGLVQHTFPGIHTLEMNTQEAHKVHTHIYTHPKLRGYSTGDCLSSHKALSLHKALAVACQAASGTVIIVVAKRPEWTR